MQTIERPQFAVVGTRVSRVDGAEKVTGDGQYVADVTLPGLLWGKILRSPFAHARVKNIDYSKALKVPGVRGVVTAADTPRRKWGAFIHDMAPLAIDKVRYVGDEVAAVAATSLDAAEEALDLIEVEYEELPAVFDAVEALQPGAPLIHDDKPGNVAVSLDIHRGDVFKAFDESDVVVENTYQSMLQWHAWIETIGSVAHYDQSGKLTIWMNVQTPFQARMRIAWALGLSVSDIRIIQTYVGGGFGGKSCDDPNAMISALLAMKTGRPVKIINTREDDFLASRPRVPMKIWVKMGFKKDGKLTAKQLKIVADNGAYSGKAPAISGVAALRHDTCYIYPNVKTEMVLVYTNKVPTGAFRGFGNPSADFAIEQTMDMGAEALGMDPVDVLRLNAAVPGYVSPHGNRVISCELKQSIDLAAELIDWKAKRANKRPNVGLGMGCTVHVSGKRHFGDWDGSSCTVKLNEDGKAFILSGEGEIGQGEMTVLAMVVAEELGLPLTDVQVSKADTDTTTYAHGGYASRLTYVSGNAARNAAGVVKQQVKDIAADILEASPEDIELGNGNAFVKGAPDRSVTIKECASQRLYRRGGTPIMGTGSFDPDSVIQDPVTRFGNESGAYNFGVQAAEVEIDTETGQVKLLNYAAVSDCGTVIHPIGAEGQVDGSVAQGLGYTISEGLLFDEGRPLNPNFSDYKMPCILDMPPLKRAFADSYEPTGPFGAKGLGELGMDPFAAVVANAVADAIGVRISTLPLTPEKVLEALRQKDAASGHHLIADQEKYYWGGSSAKFWDGSVASTQAQTYTPGLAPTIKKDNE